MNSEKTAISRTKLSKPMTMFQSSGLLFGRVLDYGCGKGKDVEILGIDGYDPFYFPTLPSRLYDTVTMNYVINTLVTHDQRMEAIRNAWRFVEIGGILVVSARKVIEIHKAAKKGNWTRHSDGWITGKKTFQKGFTPSDIEDSFFFNLYDGVVGKSPVNTTEFSHAILVKTTKIP